LRAGVGSGGLSWIEVRVGLGLETKFVGGCGACFGGAGGVGVGMVLKIC